MGLPLRRSCWDTARTDSTNNRRGRGAPPGRRWNRRRCAAPARPVRRGRQPAEARRQGKLRPPEIPRVEPVPGRMVCFFGPDSNGALPDPPGHLDPVRVLRQEPPLALFSGFGCPPPTPARREKRPCVAPVGVQAWSCARSPRRSLKPAVRFNRTTHRRYPMVSGSGDRWTWT